MNEAGVAPAGLIPIQQPITHERSDVNQYCGSSRHVLNTTAGLIPAEPPLKASPFLDREQNFPDTKQSDHCDKEIKTVEQFGKSKGQPQLSGHRVQPNGSQSEADHHRANGLERRLLAHSNKAAESKKIDAEFLWGSELQREFGDEGREQRDQDDRKQCTNERRGKRGSERLACSALPRHRMAVEGRSHRP